MTSTAYPIDQAPQYLAKNGRQAMAVDLPGASAARPLGARSGIRHGTGEIISLNTAASPVTWQITPHAGVIDKHPSGLVGPYRYATDGTGAETTGTLAAADANNQRTDIIWVQINDAAEDASGTRGIVFGRTTGAPAANPAVPGPPDRAFTLAQVKVPKAGGGAPSFITVAPLLNADVPVVRNNVEQALLPIVDGALAFRIDLDCIVRCDGAGWYPTIDFWPGGQAMQIGSPPPFGTPVIQWRTTAALTTGAGGGWGIDLPAGTFPHGWVCQLSQGDSTNDLCGLNLILANCGLNNINGIAYTIGARMPQNKAIRVTAELKGW